MTADVLHSRSAGTVRSPVVLWLHGFLGSGADWMTCARLLETEVRSLLPDLPGHGGSLRRPVRDYTMEGAAQACLDVLDRHGEDQVHLVGYSLGGRLALYLVMRYPQRFCSVLVESASPGLAGEQERAARREADDEVAQRLTRHGMERFLKAWYRQPLFRSLARRPEARAAMLERRRGNDARELARALGGLSTGRQPALWSDLKELAVPALLVVGGLDEKFVGLAREMAGLSPLLRLAIVPQAGHNVHVERPARFARLARAFWKRVDEEKESSCRK